MGLLSVILVSSLFAVNYVYKQDATNRIVDNLEYTRRVFDQLIQSRSEHLAHNAYLLSSDFGFKKVVGTGDRSTIQSALENLLERIDADIAMLVSLDKRLLADTAHPQNNGAFFKADMISQAEKQGMTMSIVDIDEQPQQMIIVPILAPNPIAWLCISFKIGAEMVEDLKRLTRSYISLVQFRPPSQLVLIASSLPAHDQDLLVSALRLDKLQSNDVFSLQLKDTRYLSSTSSLYDSSNLKVVALLQKSLDLEMIPYYRLQWFLIGIALLSLLFALMGSLLLARKVSHPVKQLVKGTREIGHGHYDYRIKIDQADELGELGAAFNEMAERRQVQETLRIAKERAESASQAKSEFLANMSHELRTPLNSILGYAQLLKKTEVPPNKHLRAIDTIAQSGQHLLALIDDLLDLSKIEAGKFEIQPSKFNLRDMLQTISDVMSTRAFAKGLTLQTHIDEDIPDSVEGDAKRLRQVLTNLIDNAIKYTPKGEVSFNVIPVKKGIRFIIKDTGIGINAHQLGFIFDSFHQAHDNKNYVQGSGLGLAICDKLVRLMGSEIKVSSMADEGSQFWFDLNLKSIHHAPAATSPNNHELVAAEGQGKRLIIADADGDNRRLLLEFLSPMGFEIRTVMSGKECIQQIVNWHPHIVLLDMQIPTTDGLEICRTVRACENLKKTVIIAISASAFDHHRQRYLTAGADEFLAKPLQLETLLQALCDFGELKAVINTVDFNNSKDQLSISQALPAKSYLDKMIAAAQRGDVQAIKEQIREIEKNSQGQTGFTNQIKVFVNEFKIKKIREFLQQNLDSVDKISH